MTTLQEVLDAKVKLTPMMQQYAEIKEVHSDALVLFRMGDFYELFFDDAKHASQILNITLTHRGKLGDFPIPMAGIPHHAASAYIDRLTGAGLRCAICEQVENPKEAKGIVKRAVTQTVSPGMPFDLEKADMSERRYLACAFGDDERYGLVLLDFVTGDFKGFQLASLSELIEKIKLYTIKEFLCFYDQWRDHPGLMDLIEYSRFTTTHLGQEYFSEKEGENYIKKFIPNYKRDQRLKKSSNIKNALSALSYYVCSTQSLEDLYHIRPFQLGGNHREMGVTYSTLLGLEILPSSSSRLKDSLFGHINRCKTSMGGRELKSQIIAPLYDKKVIQARHQLIEKLLSNREDLEFIREQLATVRDLDRILTKIGTQKANPGDLLGLVQSFDGHQKMPKQYFQDQSLLPKISDQELSEFSLVVEEIRNTISDEMGAHYDKGNLILPGANKKRDRLSKLAINADKELKNMEERYRQETGINNLKIKYNNVAGYFVEVSKIHSSKVPKSFSRRQTLVNSERYTTEELDHFEKEVLQAKEKLTGLEKAIFEGLGEKVLLHCELVQNLSTSIALIDFFQSLAWVAYIEEFSRPKIVDEKAFKGDGIWHPLIKRSLKDGFVPHSIQMGQRDFFGLITGPNMAGKTTVMREVAICQLLAQIGSFVPASRLELGLCDQLFSRLGASDDIVSGQSTFMVEMSETSEILRHSTENSLILLDEIGRGTSTFDGLSIAWALIEHLVRSKKALCLFSTHYHELIDLVDELEGAKNLTVETINKKGEVRFLYRLIEQGATQSFGIHVAKLAGLPKEILSRGQQKLSELEANRIETSDQLSFFQIGSAAPDQVLEYPDEEKEIIDELKELDINHLTPFMALQRLEQYRSKLQ